MPFGTSTRPAATATLLKASAGFLLAAGLSTGLAAPASAHAPAARTSAAAVNSSVLQIAERYVGVRYRWGGTTPAGFDCSGYTGFVFRQLGVNLPRTAHAQMGATRRVSAAEARPGDLVFFVSRGGRAYHTGIYAGNGFMYDSPRAGKSVSKRRVWSSAVVYHRAIG